MVLTNNFENGSTQGWGLAIPQRITTSPPMWLQVGLTAGTTTFCNPKSVVMLAQGSVLS